MASERPYPEFPEDVATALILFNMNAVAGEPEKMLGQNGSKTSVPGLEFEKVDGMYMLKRDLLDGGESYLAQTSQYYSLATGMKASSWVDCEADGSYAQTDSGQFIVRIEFPGSAGTDPDIETVKDAITGKMMSSIHAERNAFLEKVKADTDARFGPGADVQYVIGGHSMGVFAAVGAAQKLREMGVFDDNIRTVVVEPFGGVEAVQQASINSLKKKGIDNPTPEQFIAENKIHQRNLWGIQDKKSNMLQTAVGGDQQDDNKMPSDSDHTLTLDSQSKDMMTGHLAPQLVWAMYNGSALVAAPEIGMSAERINHGGDYGCSRGV